MAICNSLHCLAPWAAFTGLVAIAACNSDEDPHAGGTGGGAGTSTSTGGAGVGASAGAAGTGGSTASGGSSAPGGTGSGGGTTANMLSPEVLARAAVVLGSCVPDDGVNRHLSYLHNRRESARIWHAFGAQAECLATHGGGCDAVRECLGYEITAAPMDCTSGCSGTVATVCGDGARVTLDCAKINYQCDTSAWCAPAPSTACDEETFAPTCDGLTPVFCDDGAVQRGPDCASLGLQCLLGYCTGTGAACVGDPPDRQGTVKYAGESCTGEDLVACVGEHQHVRKCDAAGAGFTCQEFGDIPFCGLASECLPAEEPGGAQDGTAVRCEGTTIVLCNAGRVDRVDCLSLGFTGCDLDGAFGCTSG